MATTTPMADPAARLALFAWLSPAFPVGGFAFSHGLEWAIDAGDVRGAADLKRWLDDLLRHGALRADAVLFAAVWRDPAAIETINALALSLTASSERLLETAAQGTAFLVAVAAAWPTPALAALVQDYDGCDLAYPVAVGAAAAAHAIPLREALEIFV